MIARPALLAFLLAGTIAAAQPSVEPLSVHARAMQQNQAVPTHPDLLRDADRPIIPLVQRGTQTAPCATVFGFLPYWESAANVRYDLITHIACFSVEVNANGSLGNDHGWPWVSVINDAHAAGVKVILVATLFDGSAIDTLISSPTNRANFFANIKAKMLEGNADGLNIDFETGTTWQDEINDFMLELTNYLHTEIPGCEVTIDGPAVNWSNRWDLEGLAASCDGIFIMGYAFAGSWSSITGANAPLTGGSINITDTVLDEYGDALTTHPDKLILGVPYYGHHWTTTTSAAGATVTSFVGSTRFRDDALDVQTYGRIWHAVSQTPWYRWQVGSTWHQVWFDDAESTGMKFDLAVSEGLQGVGMWALNYDGARPELWDAIQARFGCVTSCCDLDEDGDVDQDDVNLFLFCLQGPDVAPGQFCLTGDDDEDGDVDLHDLLALQAGGIN